MTCVHSKRDLFDGKRETSMVSGAAYSECTSRTERDLSRGKRDLVDGKRDLFDGKRDLFDGKRDLLMY